MRLRAGRSLRPRRLLSRAGWAFLWSPRPAAVGGPDRRADAAAAASAADPLLPILTDELRRNVEGLKREATPPYFASYTVYDVQSAYVRASFGALVGRNQQRSRSAVVDVRVGDYALDNTREIRGDMMGGFRGFSRTALPLPGPQGEPADARPGRALAGDRSQVQAGDRALHQGQDERRGQGAGRRRRRRPLARAAADLHRAGPAGAGRRHALGRAAAPHLGAVRRAAARAHVGRDPHGGDHAALLRQHRGLADRHQRHDGAADDRGDDQGRRTAWSCRSIGPISPRRRRACRRRRSSSPTSARWSASSTRCDRRRWSIRIPARRSCPAAPPACSSTRSSAIASRGTGPSRPTTRRPSPSG